MMVFDMVINLPLNVVWSLDAAMSAKVGGEACCASDSRYRYRPAALDTRGGVKCDRKISERKTKYKR